MTDISEDTIKDKPKKSNRPLIILACILFGVGFFLMQGKDKGTAENINTLTADALEEKLERENGSADSESEDLVDSSNNIVGYDLLTIESILNQQNEIQDTLRESESKFNAFDELLTQTVASNERAIGSATAPIQSDVNDIKGDVQDIERQIKIMTNSIAEQTNDGAFRFNSNPGSEDNDEKIIERTDGLKQVTTGYIEFNDYSSALSADGLIPDMLKDELVPESNNNNTNKSGNKKTKALNAGGESQPQEDNKYNYITINSDSYVDAQLFHGIQCPIGGGATVSGEGISAVGPSPVIVKITGQFKGANGEINDIGDARLFATCIGRRTSDDDYGRAKISIQRLTYSNSLGEDFQIDGLEGYTIDVRDEVEDIKGPIDKVLGSNIFKQSIAAAMSAIGMGFSSEQYDQTSSTVTGATASIFTGSVGKDIAGQTLGTMFGSIQQYWDSLMNAEVDRVMLPAGRMIRIVINKAFVIKEPKEDTDNFDGLDDDLYI